MNPAFDHNTTTDDILQGCDLSGKTVLVTGGNSGIGTETARAMAAHGASVIITARERGKAVDAVESIRQATGQVVEVEELELDSFASIRDCASRVLARHPRIDILINNAGVMACPVLKTEDGFELQFGTNHLGHFLLTCLLVPALLASGSARVVNLSSGGHQISPVNFDDIHFERSDYDKWVSYGQSKTANILFSVGLEQRLGDKGVHAYAVHPGVIHTNLSRHMLPDELKTMRDSFTRETHVKTVAGGAATSVYAATAAELEGRGGLYLADCQVRDADDAAQGQNVLRSYAIDPANAERLWSVSEAMVGQEFPF